MMSDVHSCLKMLPKKCQWSIIHVRAMQSNAEKFVTDVVQFFDVGWDLFLSFFVDPPNPCLWGHLHRREVSYRGGGSVGLRTDSGPPLAGFVTAGRNVNPLHQTFQREKNDPWLLETVESAG